MFLKNFIPIQQKYWYLIDFLRIKTLQDVIHDKSFIPVTQLNFVSHEVYTSSHLVIERETLVIKEMQYSFVGDQNEVRLKP